MAQQSHPVREGILATVVGGLILAGLGKLTGVVPQAWDLVWRPVLWLVHGAAQRYSLTLPLLVWLVLGVSALLLLLRFVRRQLRSNIAQFEAGTEQLAKEPSLNQLEADIMAIFAREDGRMLYIHQIAPTLGISNLRAEAVLDRLVALDFLDTSMNVLHGTSYLLTRAGREYLLDKGLA